MQYLTRIMFFFKRLKFELLSFAHGETAKNFVLNHTSPLKLQSPAILTLYSVHAVSLTERGYGFTRVMMRAAKSDLGGDDCLSTSTIQYKQLEFLIVAEQHLSGQALYDQGVAPQLYN